jgi:hypothetical protein
MTGTVFFVMALLLFAALALVALTRPDTLAIVTRKPRSSPGRRKAAGSFHHVRHDT